MRYTHTHKRTHTQFTFASNTATILGGTLVGQGVQMRVLAVFFYSLLHDSKFLWIAGPCANFTSVSIVYLNVKVKVCPY